MSLTRVSRENISKGEYLSIHQWLRYHYGRADKCENTDCPGISKRFTWALKPNHKYEKKAENYLKLCRMCHAKMDVTEETRRLAKEHNENTYRTHCRKGHLLSGRNAIIRKEGWRVCRTCKNIGMIKWRKNKKDQAIEAVRKGGK